jgi:hypothetical protein
LISFVTMGIYAIAPLSVADKPKIITRHPPTAAGKTVAEHCQEPGEQGYV